MLATKSLGTVVLNLVGLVSLAAGCGGNDGAASSQAGGPSDATAAPVAQTATHHEQDHETKTTGHSVHGWWCAEHGVPEDECTRCDSSLIAGFKAKRDWCDEHDVPDSQCFVCHPEYEAKFIARYEAKFGGKPPKRLE